MENRNRNTALVLMTAGLFLLLGKTIGFFTVTSVIIVGLGIYQVRSGKGKSGYLLLAAGVLFLAASHFAWIVALLFIVVGYYFFRAKHSEQHMNYTQRKNVLESIRWNKHPWELKNVSVWSLIGEINLDLSLAMADQKETFLVFEGIIGDIDIVVPDDIGVALDATVLIGQTIVGANKEAGTNIKLKWRSPNYDACEQRVNLTVSYIVCDLNVKVL